jgi:hypothetical protein
MTAKQFKRKLEKIQRLYNEIENTFNELPEGLREEIGEYHNEDGSMQHSIRWGLQGVGEIIDDHMSVYKRAKENYDI